MQPRTPQKKKSLQQPKHETINNSYIFSLPNNSNIMQSNQSSLFAEHAQLKSSHHSININKNNKIHNTNNKISLVRKYVQQELQTRNKYAYTSKECKEYREVVISDQFVRSHHLYKMLKQQMAIADARHQRQTTALSQLLVQCQGQTKDAKDHNHQLKVELWEFKTQLMELKSLIQEEEEDNKKLVEQYEQACKYREGEEAEGEQGNDGEEVQGQYEEEEQGEEQGEQQQQTRNKEEIFEVGQNSNREKLESQEEKAQKQANLWKSQQTWSKEHFTIILQNPRKGSGISLKEIEILNEQEVGDLLKKQQLQNNFEGADQQNPPREQSSL